MRSSRLGLISALAGLALSSPGMSDEVKSIWGDELDDNLLKMKRDVFSQNIPLSVTALEAIDKAEQKRLRKQSKRIKL